MCHESSGVALNESIGIGKGTVKLEDFNKSELIMVIGQNPGTNHPRMLSALSEAKKFGSSIISNLGSLSKACAIPIRCFMPPE